MESQSTFQPLHEQQLLKSSTYSQNPSTTALSPSQTTIKHFSILPDLITGWRPKANIIPPPILIKYREDLISQLLKKYSTTQQQKQHLSKEALESTTRQQTTTTQPLPLPQISPPNHHKIIYLANRHYNSFSFHNKTQHDYHVRFAVQNQELPNSFQSEIEKFQKNDCRAFTGMNPNPSLNPDFQHKISFESNFQSGNLDMAIEIKPESQYDLFLRPDTNTCGHSQWFYFKVCLNESNRQSPKSVKFNICNNRKVKTLYAKDMKPYVFSTYKFKNSGKGWHQSGKNVVYKRLNVSKRYDLFNQKLETEVVNKTEEQPQEKGQNIFSVNDEFVESKKSEEHKNLSPTTLTPKRQQQTDTIKQPEQSQTNNIKDPLSSFIPPPCPYKGKYSILSFEYQFDIEQNQVYFAYCIPYTYSKLKKDIKSLKKTSSILSPTNCHITEQKLCISLSGLDIPLLTITDQNIPEQQKKIIIVSARIHPGQSNSSYVMKGFMDFLISNENKAMQLRKKIIFKIIPMINPDGVIVGNFRTGLAGKDLNRQFKNKNLGLLPEIRALKDYIRKLKISNTNNNGNEKKNSSEIIYYLDFHGHSTKKNVFVYGPQYDIWDQKYEKSRILPKIVSKNTEMFKINSCLYRVNSHKKSTARAFMLGLIPYCYTVQSSIGIFQEKSGQNVNFTVEKWQEMGSKIGQALNNSLQHLQEETYKNLIMTNITHKKKTKKGNKVFDEETDRRNDNSQNKSLSLQESNAMSTTISNRRTRESIRQLKTTKELRRHSNSNNSPNSTPSTRTRSKKYLEPIKNIKNTHTISSNSNSSGDHENSKVQQNERTQFYKIKEVDNESQSDAKQQSDCQSETNDFDKRQYENLSKDIFSVIDNFKKVVGLKAKNNNSSKNYSISKKKKKKHVNVNVNVHTNTNNNENSIKSQNITLSKKSPKHDNGTTIEEMKMVPSLKHKMARKTTINMDSSQNINISVNGCRSHNCGTRSSASPKNEKSHNSSSKKILLESSTANSSFSVKKNSQMHA